MLLYPLYHPAAALYTRSMLSTLEADFARIPELLAAAAPAGEPGPPRRGTAGAARGAGRLGGPGARRPGPPSARAASDEQLGLF